MLDTVTQVVSPKSQSLFANLNPQDSNRTHIFLFGKYFPLDIMEMISMVNTAIYVLLRMMNTELCDRLPDSWSCLFDAAFGSGIATSHITWFFGPQQFQQTSRHQADPLEV